MWCGRRKERTQRRQKKLVFKFGSIVRMLSFLSIDDDFDCSVISLNTQINRCYRHREYWRLSGPRWLWLGPVDSVLWPVARGHHYQLSTNIPKRVKQRQRQKMKTIGERPTDRPIESRLSCASFYFQPQLIPILLLFSLIRSEHFFAIFLFCSCVPMPWWYTRLHQSYQSDEMEFFRLMCWKVSWRLKITRDTLY